MIYDLLKPLITNKSEVFLKRSQILYNEGDLPEKVYFIEQGLVGLFHISESGKETFLRVFGKQSILGHRSFFAGEPYHATAIALAPTKLISISVQECNRICESSPGLLKQVTAQLAKELGQSELRIAGLQDKTAPRRIVEALVYLKLKFPDHVWTRKEIAEYSGSTFETVARVMSSLEKQSLIKKDGRDFIIPDPEMLLDSIEV